MRRLGIAHLKVIDNILREEEDMLAAGASSRQNTAEPFQPLLDEMIGPVLRSDAMPIPGPSTSARSGEPVPYPTPENLSPRSRRLLKKRLYMRRKRAEASGSTDLLPASVQRVKPGRKSKPRKKQKGKDGSAVVGDEDEDEHEDEEDEEDLRHSHIGGKTLHYKIKSKLESTGVDAEALRQDGLGLFHLSALSKLMRSTAFLLCLHDCMLTTQGSRMYNLLHDVPPDVSTEISSNAIQFLHAHVVQYITELVHRAIVSREQERDMKAHTKVWRFNSEGVGVHPIRLLDGLLMARRRSFRRLLNTPWKW